MEAGWDGQAIPSGSLRLDALVELECADVPLSGGRSDQLRRVTAWHLSAKNNAEEALAIANGTRDLIERVPGVKPGDIAILCRKNDTCKEIATCLEALGVRASVGQGLLMQRQRPR